MQKKSEFINVAYILNIFNEEEEKDKKIRIVHLYENIS